MHYALRRTDNNTRKASKEISSTGASIQLQDEHSLILRRSFDRYSILAFLAIEPDGQLRIVGMPVTCFRLSNRTGSDCQGKMGDLHLDSQSSISKVTLGSTDHPHSVKSSSSRSSSGSNDRCHSQNKPVMERASLIESSSDLHAQGSLFCGDLSGLVPSSSMNKELSDMFISNSKLDRSVKKKSRKKGRKKRKQINISLHDAVSTESAAFSKGCAYDTITTETCDNKKCGRENGTKFENEFQSSSPEILIKKGAAEDRHCKMAGSSDDIYSVSASSISNNSSDARDDVKRETVRITQLSDHKIKENSISYQKSLLCSEDPYNYAEKTNCYNHDCNSGNIQQHLPVRVRRGKSFKIVPVNTSVMNSYDCTGKEYNQSIQHKAQRLSSSSSNHEPQKVRSLRSKFDITVPMRRRNNCYAVEPIELPKSAEKNKFRFKVYRKKRTKPASESRAAYDFHSERISPATRTSSGICANDNMQQKKRPDREADLGVLNLSGNTSRSTCMKCSSSESGDSSDQPQFPMVQRKPHLPSTITENASGKHASLAGKSEQENSYRCDMQTCIPVNVEDSGLKISSISNCSSMVDSDNREAGDCLSKSIIEKEKEDSHAHLGQKATSNCSSHEHGEKNASSFENDSKKVEEAATDACRIQLEAEAIEMATGSPIAKFERLLRSMSPVICQSNNATSCQACSRSESFGALICRHETPSLSLGSLWKWYERHGNYGLEVMADDNVDKFTFRAYFVPFLSAIQLFRGRERRPVHGRKEAPSSGVLENCKTCETLDNSSNLSRLPIFSILVPRPCTSSPSSLLPQVPGSELSSARTRNGASVQSVNTMGSDIELLYEYFELEQPQHRRPLYEKIKELASGESSQCKEYGDPTTLFSMDLQDLHTASWYAVAWYPIYRIPDGNLRAAFLTYHSLGHLVRRNAKFDFSCPETRIVAPVIGLQSYNAQNEGWFQPRHHQLNQEARNPSSDSSAILKERLRSLQQTASLMARFAVKKGSSASVNRHPDFEFFVSRQ